MNYGRHLVIATATALALTGGFPSTASAQPPVAEELVVIPRPPERRVEVPYPAPSAEYVWHRGDWVYSPEERNFVWHPGHWVMRPDAAHTIWHPGEWVDFAGVVPLRPGALAHRGRGARARLHAPRPGGQAAAAADRGGRSRPAARLRVGPGALGLGRQRLPVGARALAVRPPRVPPLGPRPLVSPPDLLLLQGRLLGPLRPKTRRTGALEGGARCARAVAVPSCLAYQLDRPSLSPYVPRPP